MDFATKFGLLGLLFYAGAVAGFLGGYLLNASVLRGYREEADQLRAMMTTRLRDAG